MFQNTNVTTVQSSIPMTSDTGTNLSPRKKLIFEEKFVDQTVPDKYVDDETPLDKRDVKIDLVQRFVT